jgi:hypothetical protein
MQLNYNSLSICVLCQTANGQLHTQHECKQQKQQQQQQQQQYYNIGQNKQTKETTKARQMDDSNLSTLQH